MLPLVKNLGPPGEGPFYPRGIQITAALKKRSRALTIHLQGAEHTWHMILTLYSKLWVPKLRWANWGSDTDYELLQ